MTQPRQLDDRPRTSLHRRGRGVLVAVTATLALVIGGTDAYLLTQGRVSTEVELDAVLQDFRDQDASATGTTRPSGPTAAPRPDRPASSEDGALAPNNAADADADAPPVPDAPPDREPGTTTADPADGQQPAPQQPDAPQQPAAPTLALPDTGVYEYATRGHETVSFGGGRHDYPETTYASVRHDGGCGFTVEHRWVEEHVERHYRCNTGEDAQWLGSYAEVEFFGQRETSELRCDPPEVKLRLSDARGTSREFSCEGKGTTMTETVTDLGVSPMDVGGTSVEARHVLTEARMSGRSSGTARHELWLHPDTGLVLRGIRHIDTTSQAFGTQVRYVEDVEYALRSLTPRR